MTILLLSTYYTSNTTFRVDMNRITGYQSNFHFSINITHYQYHFGTKRTKGLLLSIFSKYYPSTFLTFHSIPNMEENGDPSR